MTFQSDGFLGAFLVGYVVKHTIFKSRNAFKNSFCILWHLYISLDFGHTIGRQSLPVRNSFEKKTRKEAEKNPLLRYSYDEIYCFADCPIRTKDRKCKFNYMPKRFCKKQFSCKITYDIYRCT